MQVGTDPVQSPDQPVKTLPSDGAALSVTAVLFPTVAMHLFGQSMPPPETLPLPVMLTTS